MIIFTPNTVIKSADVNLNFDELHNRTATLEEASNYSISEFNTGRLWVDFRTIYKKTISLGTLPNATSKNVAMNIIDLYRVIKSEGYAYESATGNTIFLPIFKSTTNNGPFYYINIPAGNIIVWSSDDRSGYKEAYATLWYTKAG